MLKEKKYNTIVNNYFLLFVIFILLFNYSIFTNKGYSQNAGSCKVYDIAQGISDNSINHIIQDSRENLWFATTNGITQYNATSFKIYNSENQKLAENYTLSLIEDSSNRIWVGTKKGLFYYNIYKDAFTEATCRNSTILSNLFIYSICIKNNNTLWLGTKSGLFEYNTEKNSIKKILFKHADLQNQFIRLLFFDNHNLYIGFNDQGVLKWNIKINKIQLINKDIDKSIRALVKDELNNLWIGTYDNGIYILNEQTQVIQHLNKDNNQLGKDNINQIILKQNQIIVATEGGGISFYNKEKNNFKSINTSNSTISNDKIWSICIDKQNNYWVGHYLGGITYYQTTPSPIKIINYSQIKSPIINDIQIDNSNNLLIANDEGGLILLNNKNNTLKTLLSINSFADKKKLDAIQEIYIDSKGLIWIGRYTNSIDIYNPANNKIEPFNTFFKNNIEFPTNDIREIQEDHQGNMWFATHGGGLVQFNREKNTIKIYSSKNYHQASDWLRDIEIDTHNQIWCATTYGIFMLNINTGNIKSYTKINSNLRTNSIHSIVKDYKDNIFIGSEDGLYMYNNKTDNFNLITPKFNNTSICIYSMIMDKDSNIYMSSNQGIQKYIPSNNTLLTLMKTDANSTLKFYINSACIDKNNYIYFGSNKGIIWFHRDSIITNLKSPSIEFSKFYLFDKEVIPGIDKSPLEKDISFLNDITLSNKQSFFTIEFSALNYIESNMNQYRYKMEGFDKNWIYSDKKNQASYMNLPSGDYVFTVMACNNNGIWNTKGISINIHILAPWWKTWWFILLTLSFIILLLFLIINHDAILISKITSLIQSKENKKQIFIEQLISDTSIEKTENPDELFIKNMHDLINKHLKDTDFSVDQLAQKLYMSRTQLYRRIKTITGEGPQELIDLIRLNIAKKLLENSYMNISEIAYETGYNNPLYFSRRFKQRFGITPSDYLKNNRNNNSTELISK